MVGVAIKMSLDPRKWAEDPGGMVRKTLSSWISGVFDWDDFDRMNVLCRMVTKSFVPDY